MNEIIDFLVRHWYLSGAFVVVVIAIILFELKERQGMGAKLGPSELTQLINKESAAVIDVRADADFKAGHVVGAKQVAADNVIDQAKKLQKKDKPLVLVDDDGRQASKLASKLAADGLPKIYYLAGGIASWKEAGMPLEKVET